MNPADAQAALRLAQDGGLARLDAQMLLLHALARDPQDRAWLLAHDRDPLPAAAWQRYQGLCQQRLDGVPVAYLVGWRDFHGLRLQVDARVLDPRPDTETLVDWGLEVMASRKAPRLLDLGTGSGAIALALQHQRPDAQVWAVDASADALAVAQANGQRLRLPVHWRLGHWLRHWTTEDATGVAPPNAFDLIVSNPPYIRDDDPHLPALRHEPRQALTSGADGLDDLRQIVAQAPPHLAAGGWLLLEHGWDQADAVADLLRSAGLQAVQHRLDLTGHRRCTGGQHRPTA